MKTFSAKPLEVKRDWFVVDASDKVLGRLASEAQARIHAARRHGRFYRRDQRRQARSLR